MAKKWMTVHIDEDIIKKVNDKAKKKDMPRNELVAKILRKAVDKKK